MLVNDKGTDATLLSASTERSFKNPCNVKREFQVCQFRGSLVFFSPPSENWLKHLLEFLKNIQHYRTHDIYIYKSLHCPPVLTLWFWYRGPRGTRNASGGQLVASGHVTLVSVTLALLTVTTLQLLRCFPVTQEAQHLLGERTIHFSTALYPQVEHSSIKVSHYTNSFTAAKLLDPDSFR